MAVRASTQELGEAECPGELSEGVSFQNSKWGGKDILALDTGSFRKT